MVACLKEQIIGFKGFSYVFHSRFLIRNDKKITIKIGTIKQVFSVSIKTVMALETKNELQFE